MKCPNGHENVLLRKAEKRIKFRDVEIAIPAEVYRCSTCSVEFGTVEQTSNVQKEIAEAYRQKIGLLTGKDLIEKRNHLGWTQGDLAKRMSVGIASIKRWETGSIQSKSMDLALRLAFEGQFLAGIECREYENNDYKQFFHLNAPFYLLRLEYETLAFAGT